MEHFYIETNNGSIIEVYYWGNKNSPGKIKNRSSKYRSSPEALNAYANNELIKVKHFQCGFWNLTEGAYYKDCRQFWVEEYD